jgi:ligand-binding SRPBCC domain-containing protein
LLRWNRRNSEVVTTYTLKREQLIRRPLPEVFDFFSRPENLERLTPPRMHFQILTPPPIQLGKGTIILYALRARGIPLRWLTEIKRWNPPYEFVDIQAKGPYRLWHHTHRFSEVDGCGTRVVDIVDYTRAACQSNASSIMHSSPENPRLMPMPP